MSSSQPESKTIDGELYRFALVAARYNQDLVDGLLERTRVVLLGSGVLPENIEIVRVPGSGELPYAVQRYAETGFFDCCVALGLLMKGETHHYEITARSVSDALHIVALDTRVPVINGVIIADDPSQARARTGARLDRGGEFAHAALEMAALKKGRDEPNE
ncbi:MAG: 6,7-dimethyl-8-ribityllumazine synthase [Opitutales bacterium]